eukprot:6181479-Pleurochrysis_carterae.AAC.1
MPFFEFCMQWFDGNFLTDMAADMQQTGREFGARWAGWKVTKEDLIQWMGVWYYMLAFPQAGDRRQYFNQCVTFGPVHNLEPVLALAGNGPTTKGIKWFENMIATFTLPQPSANSTTTADPDDDFRVVRRMWEDCRAVFVRNLSPGWLIIIDESMVKWVGREMPGLMV